MIFENYFKNKVFQVDIHYKFNTRSKLQHIHRGKVGVIIAREYKIARGCKIAQIYFYTKTLLREGTKLHEDTFARRVIYARVDVLFI